MKTILILAFLTAFPGLLIAQSLHQAELLNHPDLGTEVLVAPNSTATEKSTCDLNKMVFGWHPYWMNGAEDNYQWDLISDFCFFGYEVDYATGNATSTHSWLTNDAVDTALVKGKQVHLCVMLFANHAAFFGNSTARTTLINNLVSTLQTRGAHGINIDFEGVPASQSANLTSFMTDLGAALHAANPNYKLSICLYAVDWNNVFNETALNTPVDFYTIMGYDYYYSGSSQAGPTDPLYGFTDGYDYSLSRSVSYYLNAGIPTSKLVLGLPYYGKEWETSSNAIPSPTTGNNNYSRTYDYVKTNSTGFYTNPIVNTRASSRAYVFQNTGTWRQCWISEENELRDRYDLVNRRDLKGIALWTFGYDDGYSELWDAINDKLTTCNTWACSDTLYDEGGPEGFYYNNELVEYTISPPGATAINVSFPEFNTEANYDTLWVYDGASSASNLIGAFQGTSGPGSFTTITGHLTLKFKSDGGTRAAGWKLVYSCIQDNVAPEVSSVMNAPWLTEDEEVTISATDGSGISKVYWNAQSLEGNHWESAVSLGHVEETFDAIDNWTSVTGNWNLAAGTVLQSDDASTNTNLALTTPLTSATDYLYRWKASINGTGTNRRAGFHFMCSDLSLPNRGNSYFVWFRVDSDVIQVYEVTNDVFALTASFPYAIDPAVSYDCITTYSSGSGEIKVFVDGQFVGSWMDNSPLTVSTGISLRSGNATFTVDEVSVYVGTNGTETVQVGPAGHFYQCNPAVTTASGKIATVAVDVYNNLGFNEETHNIDFTLPTLTLPTEENTDIDTLLNTSDLNLAGLTAEDLNSDIASLTASVKKQDGTVILPAFQVSASTFFATLSGLENGEHYFIELIATNGASLTDSTVSDGFVYISTIGLPEQSMGSLDIFPNPTQDVVTIRSEKELVVRIYSEGGELVKMIKVANGEASVDMTTWSAGAYFFGTGTEIYKVVKR